jgi:peptidoglycan/LPS O-acetylase OafA/YrhL
MQKEKTAAAYAIGRFARLYSVMIPAILLSGLVWLVASIAAPTYLLPWTSPYVNLGDLSWLYQRAELRFGAQSAVSLLFLNQAHGYRIFPAMNSPFWSLGFEGPYYLFYGILIFSKGAWRIGMLAVSAVLFGWAIVGLFPAWLAGVGLHRLTLRLHLPPKIGTCCGVLSLGLSVAFALEFSNYLSWIRAHANYAAIKLLDGGYADTPNMWSSINHLFYYSVVGGFMLILGLHCLERQISPLLLRVETPVRWCAAHTFSIYLYHFPLLVLIAAVTHYNGASGMTVLGVVLLDLLLCVVLSLYTEEKKGWWREHIRSLFDRVQKGYSRIEGQPYAAMKRAPSRLR